MTVSIILLPFRFACPRFLLMAYLLVGNNAGHRVGCVEMTQDGSCIESHTGERVGMKGESPISIAAGRSHTRHSRG